MNRHAITWRSLVPAMIALAIFGMPAHADVLVVCPDGTCEYSIIQDAVDAASDGDDIAILPGTYYGTQPGQPIVRISGKQVRLVGINHPPPLLNGEDLRQCIRVENGGEALVQAIDFTRGIGTHGGAIYCTETAGDVTFQACTFDDCKGIYGGGVAYLASNATTTFSGCTMTNNAGNLIMGDGGAIKCLAGSLNTTQCIFSGNEADIGGAILCTETGGLSATNCTFSQSTANTGGAIYLDGVSSNITDVTFTQNSADYGGAIAYNNAGDAKLVLCTITDNTNLLGSAIHIIGDGPELADTLVCGNGPADPVSGNYSDLGGNCLAIDCTDKNGNGLPDECDAATVLHVPDDYPTINAAIAAAVYGNIIEVAEGTHLQNTTILPSGKAITIRGVLDKSGNRTTILDFQNAHVGILCHSGEGPNTRFQDLEIANGSGFDGGGMRIIDASPTVANCRFFECNASNNGGGVHIMSGSPSFVDCVFWGNHAENNGGAAYVTSHSNPMFSDVNVYYNSAMEDGGGFLINMESNVTIQGGSICVNTCTGRGGGIMCDSSELTITSGKYNSMFCANYATFGSGLACLSASPTVEETRFTSQQGEYGAGIYLFNSDPVFNDCEINYCEADYGAAVYMNTNSNPQFIDCFISNNTSTRSGGVLRNAYENASPLLSGTTLCGNTPEHLDGNWAFGSGNCFATSCADDDSNQVIDECESDTPQDHSVPGDFDTIQNAIDAAANGDRILVGPGSWTNDDGDDAPVFNTRGKRLTIESTHGRNDTFIDGEHLIRCAVFTHGEEADTIIDGFTFYRGSAADNEDGGGILIRDSSPTIRNCSFIWNFAGDFDSPGYSGTGAGLHVDGGSPYIEGSYFTSNIAEFGGGGAAMDNLAEPTFSYCTFQANQSSYAGGGLLVRGGSIPTIEFCDFVGHIGVPLGSGLAVLGEATDTRLVYSCDFVSNRGIDGAGAAIVGASVDFLGCRFVNNIGTDGGGLHADNSETHIASTAFIGNSADSGGAAWIWQSSGVLHEVDFTSNQANHGGGILGRGSGTNITGNACVFRENTGFEEGGGIRSTFVASVYLEHSQFIENDGGGMVIDLGAPTALYGNFFCGNTPEAIEGDWNDDGQNMVSENCSSSPADLNGDGVVDSIDLGLFLASWGTCAAPCPADFDGNGVVNGFDLGTLISAWGI
ncbi:MAG: hypothetical protein MK085_09645 [Phycisphaerales bacterium]|nr:hypothetical protein [Phycisphaerales bacterium]